MLVGLEKYQKERDRIIAEFDLKIANLEAVIITLEQDIVDAEEQISLWSIEVENLQTQVSTWQQRKKTAEFLYDALVRNYKWEVDDACEEFNVAWSDYARVERKVKWWLGQWGALLDYVHIWMPPGTIVFEYARSIEVKNILVSEANKQFATAQTNITEARNALSAAQNTLEAKTRHMRDLQLAKEAAEEEKRGALALWEAEYQAALERKRIEIASIARDLALGYPTMEAEMAREIAETAYGDALARGFTRLADVIQIASDLADEWWNRWVFPHLTTTRINCPSCAAELDLTVSDILEHNKDLVCPQCANFVAEGFSVRWIIEPNGPSPLPIAGIWDWLGKYWPAVATCAVITTGLGIWAAKKK